MEYRKVDIPTSVCDKIQKRIEGTEFGSVSEYVTFVLTELLAAEDEGIMGDERKDEDVKNRLRSLGYLD